MIWLVAALTAWMTMTSPPISSAIEDQLMFTLSRPEFARPVTDTIPVVSAARASVSVTGVNVRVACRGVVTVPETGFLSRAPFWLAFPSSTRATKAPELRRKTAQIGMA